MTRNEQLKFCKICQHQKFDFNQGIICSLTNQPADFETSCNSFTENIELKNEAELKQEENEILNKTASAGKRFTNYMLDFIFIMIFSFMFGIVLGMIEALVSPESSLFFEEDNQLLDYLYGFILTMAYYTVFETTTGRTIAKFITKTKVVDKNGEKPDIGTVLIRSLCRFIPFDAFSFLGSDASGWHDKISKTSVIETPY